MGGFGWRGGPWGDEAPSTEGLAGWLAGRLPSEWFREAPEVTVDREEITIVGVINPPELGAEVGEVERAAAERGRIQRFREQTREERIQIAAEIEHRYGRKVAWGAVSGATRELFTNLSVPVMTRLRQPERLVLDTLVDAGVARSRSDALAWCVRLVGRNAGEWLAELRAAMEHVQQVRATGPAGAGGGGGAAEPAE
jgi:hypothetical protein